MTLKEARQVPAINWEDEKETIFLAAAGYESRGPHAAERLLPKANDIEKLTFGFAENKAAARILVERKFASLGFRLIDDVPSASGLQLTQILSDKLRSSSGKQFRLIVDYSCMTKTWYGAIVRHLFDIKDNDTPIETYFVYSPARFAPPGPPGVNKIAGAISGFGHLSSPLKPSALILGLGYEAVRAMGLRDYIDPEVTIAFYTDPALDQKYRAAVARNNSGLLTTLSPNVIFRYPVADLDYTNALLQNVALGLRDQYRVIVAPLGPKPFCLLSLILSAENNGIDVWRVSLGEEITPQERVAAGMVLIYRLIFV